MKVLLVDDHPLILQALRNIIHTLDSEIEVVTCDNPHDAFARLSQETDFDLVLLDLMLGPAVDGYGVLAGMRERFSMLPVVVVSAVDRLTEMVRVIDMGAMGFVPKTSATPELFDAVALVLSGGVFIPTALLSLVRAPGMSLAEAAAAADAIASEQAVAALALQGAGHWGRPPAPVGLAESPVLRPMGQQEPEAEVSNGLVPAGQAPEADTLPAAIAPPAPPQAVAEAVIETVNEAALVVSGPGTATRASLAAQGLTPRQTDVLLLLLRGLPNKLIARELSVSVDTIKDHVAAVLRALGVNSRTQAVLLVSGLSQASARRAAAD